MTQDNDFSAVFGEKPQIDSFRSCRARATTGHLPTSPRTRGPLRYIRRGPSVSPLPRDRLSPLVINADNPKSVLCALIVDSQWRMRPSTNELPGPESVRGAIDGRGREPLDQRDDGLHQLACPLRCARPGIRRPRRDRRQLPGPRRSSRLRRQRPDVERFTTYSQPIGFKPLR